MFEGFYFELRLLGSFFAWVITGGYYLLGNEVGTTLDTLESEIIRFRDYYFGFAHAYDGIHGVMNVCTSITDVV